MDSGRPYSEALAQVEALLGEDRSLVAPLRPQADSGAPTLPALRRAFDDVARAVIEAAAAGEGDHWLDHVRGRLADHDQLMDSSELVRPCPIEPRDHALKLDQGALPLLG